MRYYSKIAVGAFLDVKACRIAGYCRTRSCLLCRVNRRQRCCSRSPCFLSRRLFFTPPLLAYKHTIAQHSVAKPHTIDSSRSWPLRLGQSCAPRPAAGTGAPSARFEAGTGRTRPGAGENRGVDTSTRTRQAVGERQKKRDHKTAA